MSVLQTSILSEPTGTDMIPMGTLIYFRARLKQHIYSLVIKEFKKSALSKADLARRLDMDPAQLSRLLSGPGNVTSDTASDLLFAISGAELDLGVSYPLSRYGKAGFGREEKWGSAAEAFARISNQEGSGERVGGYRYEQKAANENQQPYEKAKAVGP